MSRRILVTGSRNWTDREAIRAALATAFIELGSRPDTVLVQGECHLGGADQIAKEIWEARLRGVRVHLGHRGLQGVCGMSVTTKSLLLYVLALASAVVGELTLISWGDNLLSGLLVGAGLLFARASGASKPRRKGEDA